MSGTWPLYSTHAARALDARATQALGGDPYVLMQRAGLSAWQQVLLHWPEAHRIVVVCGPGSNGGDGYVLARHAHRAGRHVEVVHLPVHVPGNPVAQRACTEYVAGGGQVTLFGDVLPRADIVVDALFGIGLSRAPETDVRALIDAINAQAAPVFSLDVPSGVDADRGCAPGVAVLATRTLQFIARHAGLYTGDALEYTGVLAMEYLDVPADAFDGAVTSGVLLDHDALARWLLPRRRNTHKGESGHVLCIGGDEGGGGAIALCAEAALRAGAGLVSVATRPSHVPALLARRPEAMVRAVESTDELTPLLERARVVALGPGMGQGEWGSALFRCAMRSGKPKVLDADALNLLAMSPQALEDAILTPHPGEAARLLDCTTADVQQDRFSAARAIAQRYACAVVLKGAGTVVAAPGEVARVLDAGNPGMAVGGMGDVLTGVIAALRAQGLSAFDAASAGALLHSLAGDAAAWDGQRGLLPSDLFAHLRRLANP
ncbi:NAD(P)H-hydrate dehydratase [Pseudoxanthomonas sp. PXM02]|uniref:NAD(P)H-hydrate dehydratase n=1 Tax=Pseudoxanthomonas sp. PXM02 TaxID=2769294 RepID=UPI0017801C78|nr:NAD(P)H-hydrate dehydratase [Pseudoxanthomonas sp. PXM02]MBD9479943.1 NAD(P)H-hydrate dehydratase [Pseudoxanthomonas sp. PXM02]